MAELPLVVAVIAGAGLLAAGLAGIAASLATMGVMLAVGGTGATSFDPPRAASIAHARWGMVVVGLASALAAALLEVDLLSLVCWSASIAAAGLFPALVLGIWWRRANAAGCAAGILAGSGIALAYILGTTVFAVSFHETWGGLSDASPVAVRRYAQLKELLSEAEGPMAVALQARLLEQAQAMAGWWGVSNRAAGLFGVPVGFVAIVLVSLMTPRPRREQQVELARLRGR